jgi:hypothetical protein
VTLSKVRASGHRGVRMMPSPESCEERMAQEFKAGDQVPSSGVYRVLHKGHRDEHDATLREGEQFPVCTVCKQEVRFRLVQSATSIDRDADFISE